MFKSQYCVIKIKRFSLKTSSHFCQPQHSFRYLIIDNFAIRKDISNIVVTDSATLPDDQRTRAELLLFIDQDKNRQGRAGMTKSSMVLLLKKISVSSHFRPTFVPVYFYETKNVG